MKFDISAFCVLASFFLLNCRIVCRTIAVREQVLRIVFRMLLHLLQEEVEETKIVMHNTIQSVLERGEPSSLVTLTAFLRGEATQIPRLLYYVHWSCLSPCQIGERRV